MTLTRKLASASIAALLLALAGSALAAPAPAAPNAAVTRPYEMEFNVRIPMRDGAHLSGTIFRPKDQKGPLPVILTITPYVADRFTDVGAYFAQHGYVFASVDSRGRGNSDGVFTPWVVEGPDGYDAIEWLAKQPWSDGQVGTWGGSYGGKNQWMFAGEAPPALKTIVPTAAGMVGENIGMHNGNIHRAYNFNWIVNTAGATANGALSGDDAYWMGAYADISRGDVPHRDFDKLAGYPSAIWQEWMRHPTMDAFWDAASPDPAKYAKIKIPVLSISGQYDVSQTGTQKFRRWHMEAVEPAVADQSYLLIGPWNHPGTRVPKRKLGGVDMGEAALLDVKGLHVAWFDYVMKGGPRPAFLKDHFVYYLLGANEWRSASDVAAATARTETLVLSSPKTSAGSIGDHGVLVAKAGREAPDAYVYDPGLPGLNEGFEAAELVPDYLTNPGMMRRLDGDGLVYDTAPLSAPANLVGTPSVDLTLAMDVPDTDIRVALYAVHPDGTVIFLAQDQVRARYRKSTRKAELVTPGKPDLYRFKEFPFVAHRLEAGTVIRMLVVPLGASMHNERNRNAGGVIADETNKDNRIAHVRVLLGGASKVRLPWGA
jgi:uncharacterized protein